MARQLPKVRINNKWYYQDDRLKEFRNVDDPHDRISFREQQTGPAVKQIRTLEELKKESEQGACFFIALNYGAKSSKWIMWQKEDNQFFISNLIDDSEQLLTPEQIMDEKYTNIGKAMKLGALFFDEI